LAKHPQAPGYKAGWCIHYRAPSYGDACAAGVKYADLRDGDKRPTIDRSPCFIEPGQTAADRSPCPKLRPPTPREIDQYNAWLEVRTNHLFTALVSLENWVEKNKGRHASTTIPCPACGSALYVSKTASNNHTRGQCSRSKYCIGWIQ
jgi:hypothetical protein